MTADAFITCLKNAQFKQDLDDFMDDAAGLSLDDQSADTEMECRTSL